MPTKLGLKDLVEKHPLWAAVTFMAIGWAVREAVGLAAGATTITAARLERLETAADELKTVKNKLIAKQGELSKANERIDGLTGENLRLRSEADDAKSQLEIGTQVAATSISQQCAKEVNIAVRRTADDATRRMESEIESRKAAAKELRNLANLAIDQRDASDRQLKACLFPSKGEASYPKFQKAWLHVSYSGGRSKDATVLASALSKYFENVAMTACNQCNNNARLIFPLADKVSSGTDLAALLVELGYKEFENPIMDSGPAASYSITLN
jgi:hypothetical protein